MLVAFSARFSLMLKEIHCMDNARDVEGIEKHTKNRVRETQYDEILTGPLTSPQMPSCFRNIRRKKGFASASLVFSSQAPRMSSSLNSRHRQVALKPLIRA
jgi:hypothetical protein